LVPPFVGKVWCCEVHRAVGGPRQVELLAAPEIGAKPTGDAGGYAEYGENLVLSLGFSFRLNFWPLQKLVPNQPATQVGMPSIPTQGV
jgi:hypothetical protein